MKQENFFIDTNIIVDSILFNENKEQIGQDNPLYDILKSGFELLDFYFKNDKKIRMCTSFLNICEMPSILIESLVQQRMYLKRIPFNYFETYRKRFLKEKRFKKEIKEVIEEYYNFLVKHKIWFIHKCVLHQFIDFKEIEKLRINFELPMIDSLIFFIACQERGYFVTNDRHHFLNNKPLKESYKQIIKIVSPQQALDILKDKTTGNITQNLKSKTK